MKRCLRMLFHFVVFLNIVQQTPAPAVVSCNSDADCGANSVCNEQCQCKEGFYSFGNEFCPSGVGCFATCDIAGDGSECNNGKCQVKFYFPECVCEEGFEGVQCDERISTTMTTTTTESTTTRRRSGALPVLAAAVGIPVLALVAAGILGTAAFSG
ncbi:neurogenic locus protein delta-like isoform X2 [Saccostrea cucullata]|uniref:neurogenic locus protein delta-like isoform X2 n=1 Tax=Saccostrea cuccullata TaxID=36930 RepID=UPI002ED6B9A2